MAENPDNKRTTKVDITHSGIFNAGNVTSPICVFLVLDSLFLLTT